MILDLSHLILRGSQWRAIGLWIKEHRDKIILRPVVEAKLYTRDIAVMLLQMDTVKNDLRYQFNFSIEGHEDLLVEFKLRYL